MLSEYMLDKYKSGFAVHGSHPIETVEWVLSQSKSDDSRLYFIAYDANLYPLNNMSEWYGCRYVNKQVDKGLEFTKNFNGVVWMDDIRIK